MPGTLPARIAQRIAHDFIDGGLVAPGERLPSIRELKVRYGATNTTICGALNILESQGRVVKQHGRGSFVAEPGGMPDRAGLLGLLLPHPRIGSRVLAGLAVGVERAARAAGYRVMATVAGGDYATEREDLARLVEGGCRGLILRPAMRTREELTADYLAGWPALPTVLVETGWPEQGRSRVLLDQFRAGADVTRWLLGRGHRRIAFMDWRLPAGEPQSRPVQDRRRGYREALVAAGRTQRRSDLWTVTCAGYGADPVQELRKHLGQWQAEPDHATAVLALDDRWASMLIELAGELGIDVPGDLEVAGFDGTVAQRPAGPRFTTTAPDFERLGDSAVQVLLQQLRGDIDRPIHYLHPAPLAAREDERRLEPA